MRRERPRKAVPTSKPIWNEKKQKYILTPVTPTDKPKEK